MHYLKLLFLSKPERAPERGAENSHFPVRRGGRGAALPRKALGPGLAVKAWATRLRFVSFMPVICHPSVRVSRTQQPCSGWHLESVEGVAEGKWPWCHDFSFKTQRWSQQQQPAKVLTPAFQKVTSKETPAPSMVVAVRSLSHLS